MPSGNFVDVSRHRKTTPTSPKKAKALGRRGRKGRVSWCVCVWASGWCYWKPASSRNSAPAVQANSPLCLCFYTVLYPGTPGSESAAKHQPQWALHPPLLHHLHHYILLSHFALSLSGCWKFLGKERISQNRLQGKTQKFQPCFAGCGRPTTHFLAALTALLVTLIWNRVKEILC